MGGGAVAVHPKGPSPLSPDFPDTVGPFLRFQGGTGPGDDSWAGSVLFLTRTTGATSNGANVAEHGPQQPSLMLTDTYAGGKEDSTQTCQLIPAKLASILGWSFWRFDIALQLAPWQRSVEYSITAGSTTTPTYAFWLPAEGQPMHWGYTSCNGFSGSIPMDAPERQDPTYLWKDLLQLHSAFPLHCLVGGGDQLYNDPVWAEPALKAWGDIKEHGVKVAAEWTADMEAQAVAFYLANYINSFTMKDVCDAYAQIPQVMMWDDHDVWDGYGSYDVNIQQCNVFKGLFAVARKFYLLFQQHTTDEFNKMKQEFLTNDGSEFHYVKYMGPQVVLMGVDMRSQRLKSRILPQATYDLLKRTVDGLPSGPQHLVMLSGIPVVFPKMPAAESILGCISSLTRNVKSIRNMARSTGLLDSFDQPEILDDLVDGWVADVHTEERLQFIHLLQHFATSKNLRVSILSGDAHVGGVGRLYSHPKHEKIWEDPLYMPQIVSSAMMNAPPPQGVVRMLMKTNFSSKVDKRTREKMVRAFYPHHPRTDKLISQRNWCDITLVAPPFAPPMVPSNPDFGGLRFVLRVEDAKNRVGHAEEMYTVVAPRHPAAARGLVATGLGNTKALQPTLSLPQQSRQL